MRIVTASEMKEIDGRASNEFGISALRLMENAGKGLAVAAKGLATQDSRFLVVCGPGNNGGDGMAAAVCIAEQEYDVTVLLAVRSDQLKGEALAQYRRLAESDVALRAVGEPDYERAMHELGTYDVIVDALLGTGSRGEPKGEILRLTKAILEAEESLVISADIPTGIDCDTGVGSGDYVVADLTVMFGLAKPFPFQNQGLTAAPNWKVVDIGLPEELTSEAGSAMVLSDAWARERLPSRPPTAHKRTSGVVLVVAGSDSFPGAAVLTAHGALRAGAGLVQVAAIPSVLQAVKGHLPECPLVHLPGEGGFISPEAASLIADAAQRCDAIAIGPGLGRQPLVGALLEKLWETLRTRWALDADALFWLSESKARPLGEAVLTPHEGEAARLAGTSADDVRKDRFGAVRRLAEKYGQTVLLKGPYTLTAAPAGPIAVNPTGNQGLATGGTGDVLTGIVGALVASGLPACEAAALSAFWHGLSADLLAERLGVGEGFLASEVADGLLDARRAIQTGFVEDDAELDDEENLEE